jgi:alcohol dehydrogenase class IV
MNFDWVAPGRIRFGDGVASELPSIVAEMGGPVFLVTGSDPNRPAAVVAGLERLGVAGRWHVKGEPTVELAIRGGAAARESGAALVVAVGGGAVLDAGKAIAALARNPGDPLEFLEVIGRGRPLVERPLPVIAVPTTSGTGSEATRNAVLSSPEHRLKVSLRSPWMMPRVAVVDPRLTWTMPESVTAASGLDALTQLLEPFVCAKSNCMTDALCREGLSRVGQAFARVLKDPLDAEARAEMAWCSLAGGQALANAGLGVVHGFAGPIGGMFGIAHGIVCAALLAPGTAANIAALEARSPHHPVLGRYDEAMRRLSGSEAADRHGLAPWLERLVGTAGIPRLSALGLNTDSWAEVVAAAQGASSMRANPIVLTGEELGVVLQREAEG